MILGKSSTLSFCTEPNSEVAKSIIQHNPRHPGEVGPSKTVGEGQTKILFLTPHPPQRAPSPQGEGFLRLMRHWILQLRASPACRMTC